MSHDDSAQRSELPERPQTAKVQAVSSDTLAGVAVEHVCQRARHVEVIWRVTAFVLAIVLLFPFFYFVFNFGIRSPLSAVVAGIPFIVHAMARSLQTSRTSRIVLAWANAVAWILYGQWEQFVSRAHPDWNIRVDLLAVLAILYPLTLAYIWGLLFPIAIEGTAHDLS